MTFVAALVAGGAGVELSSERMEVICLKAQFYHSGRAKSHKKRHNTHIETDSSAMTQGHDQEPLATTLTHVDATGQANMVDVGDKAITQREARAAARVDMQPATLKAIRDNQVGKGEVLAVARIAGIQAAKRCADLIPLCHPLALSKVAVEFELDAQGIEIQSYCKLSGQTGVEMEALTAASVAALTIYDMCKAMDKAMTINAVRLLEKRGGKSGVWLRDGATHD